MANSWDLEHQQRIRALIDTVYVCDYIRGHGHLTENHLHFLEEGLVVVNLVMSPHGCTGGWWLSNLRKLGLSQHLVLNCAKGTLSLAKTEVLLLLGNQ